jgi:hypothetical protein
MVRLADLRLINWKAWTHRLQGFRTLCGLRARNSVQGFEKAKHLNRARLSELGQQIKYPILHSKISDSLAVYLIQSAFLVKKAEGSKPRGGVRLADFTS